MPRPAPFGSSGMDGFNGIAASSWVDALMTTSVKSSVGARSVAQQAPEGFASGFRVVGSVRGLMHTRQCKSTGRGLLWIKRFPARVARGVDASVSANLWKNSVEGLSKLEVELC